MVAPNRPAKITVDFTGIEIRSGGGADHIPEGDYLVETVDCQQRGKKADPSIKMLNWHFRVVEPAKFRGKNLYNNTVLQPESLWALRSMLVDMLGEDKVPQSSLSIPIGAIVAKKKRVGVSVEDDEYNGKIKSKIVGTFSEADWTSRGADIPNKANDINEGDSEDDVKEATTSSDDDEDMDEIDLDDL